MVKKLNYFLLFPALVLSACQSFNSVVQEPALSLNSVDVAGISLNGVDLVAHVDVENPNVFSIPLPKIDWELFVNDASFVRGILPGDQNIRSRDRVTIDLPVSVSYSELYKSFKSLIETKEAAYTIALGISFPIPVIESKVYRLDFSGVLPLPRIPVLKPGSMRISKIDFSGVELAWNVDVENPNAFPIPFPEIAWDYDVNGVPVVKSSFAGAGEIAAGAAGTALISVGVAYADVFKAVASAGNAGEAASNLSLDAGIPIPALEGVKTVLDIPGTLPVLRKPEIAFQGITRKSLGTTMEFILNLEVDNKNNFECDIGEFVYDFRVNNREWAGGRVENPPKIKAGGKTLIPVTISVSALGLVREIVDIINRGEPVNYTCAGNMSLSGNLPGLDKLELPLNLRGSARIR